MELSANMEDYLETIYLLKKEKGYVRLKELASCLKVKLSSASDAVKKLTNKELLEHKRYGQIIMTKKGEEIAKRIYTIHTILTKFLSDILKVENDIAKKDACKIEHVISKTTLNKLKDFIKLKNGDTINKFGYR